MDARTAETLDYPFPTPPAPGEVIEVAPGILWVRMPLPFRLNHVNIYLIEDGDDLEIQHGSNIQKFRMRRRSAIQ